MKTILSSMKLQNRIMGRYAPFILATSLLATAPLFAKEVNRPPLMTERLLLAPQEEHPADGRIWDKTLLDMGIPGLQPRESGGYSECHFDTALTTLTSLRIEGAPQSYQIIWAKNQDKVFAACDGSKENGDPADPPIAPHARQLPRRATSDFQYQLGSWHFYRHEYQEALQAYQQTEKARSAPLRAKAAYMTIRCLAYLDQGDAAYDKILKVLAEPSLKEVHAIASNYRFVMMNNTRYSDVPHVTPDLALRHLKWLLDVVKVDPAKAEYPAQAQADYNDALAQLDVYFPPYDEKTKQVDWWLNDGGELSPRMQAVKTLAPRNEFVDWMQAQWAYNVFTDDWLWALHAQSNPYWEQSRRVTEHEFMQWERTGNGVWLDLALSRVGPSDPLADVLLQAAEPYLARPWQSETTEYRQWLFDLWEHSIRIALAKKRNEQALEIFADHQDFARLFDGYQFGYRYQARHEASYASALEKMLRWLVYTGQPDQARNFLNAFQKNMPNSYNQWRTLLATSVEEIPASGIKKNFQFSDFGNSKRIWQEMLNTESSSYLDHLIEDDRLDQNDRAMISRTLLARAILLHADAAAIDHAAAVAAKHNPAAREEILTAISGHDSLKYVEFLLKNPRFRPAIFLEYGTENWHWGVDVKTEEIDPYNHNDNNWWCRFDDKQFVERLFDAAKIVPAHSRLFNEQETAEEFNQYLENQQELLAKHPYHQTEDVAEMQALVAIPSGPEYLSRYVIQWEKAAPPAQTEEDRDRRAANLHRAVRTTRYGCDQNGPHAEYSKEAFTLLHDRYQDTPWAKATPYWFK